MSTPICAIGRKGQGDAMTQIRLAQPLRALAQIADFHPKLYFNAFKFPWGEEKGIIVSNGVAPEDEEKWDEIDAQCKAGWLWIHDVDDALNFDAPEAAAQIRAITSAHYITSASASLLDFTQAWNPHGEVLPSQIGPLPPPSIVEAKVHLPKIFYEGKAGHNPWGKGLGFVVDTLEEHEDHIEVFCVDDPQFAAGFGADFPLRNFRAQSYTDYLKMIDHMDIALIPFMAGAANRAPSDIKIIEALAHGMIPIVAELAAKNSKVPQDLMMIVKADEDWAWHLNTLLDAPQDLVARKQKGYDYIRLNRLWSEHAGDVERVYLGALSRWEELERSRSMRVEIRRAKGG